MKRYAFIDATNTQGTTQRVLDFSVDWRKLFQHLKERWGCIDVFYYEGIWDNKSGQQKAKSLRKTGYILRSKPIFVHRTKNLTIDLECPHCKENLTKVLEVPDRTKANCDVELTVDALELAGPDASIL